jgi:GT2 family glycosyltransferase
MGIRLALTRGAEFVLVLNNDTTVHPRFLAELLAVAAREERAGFVSPKIYFMTPPDLVWFAGARYFLWCGYGRMSGYRVMDRGQFERVREIDRPAGCAVLVSRALCEEVGLMDPSLFLYMEEVEWMLRARGKGFRAYLAPKAKVWHKVSASLGGEGSPDALYYGIRNTLYALRAHSPASSGLSGGLRTALVAAVFLLSAFRLLPGTGKRFRAVLDGVGDFRKSRMGRRRKGEG